VNEIKKSTVNKRIRLEKVSPCRSCSELLNPKQEANTIWKADGKDSANPKASYSQFNPFDQNQEASGQRLKPIDSQSDVDILKTRSKIQNPKNPSFVA
jgi:hypothetical protein